MVAGTIIKKCTYSQNEQIEKPEGSAQDKDAEGCVFKTMFNEAIFAKYCLEAQADYREQR